jgi:hypothetical protein
MMVFCSSLFFLYIEKTDVIFEDRGSVFLRNLGMFLQYLQDHTALLPARPTSACPNVILKNHSVILHISSDTKFKLSTIVLAPRLRLQELICPAFSAFNNKTAVTVHPKMCLYLYKFFKPHYLFP